jgi:hypothetical protein
MIRLNLLPPEEQGRARGTSNWTTAQGHGPRDSTAPVVWIAVVPAFALAVGVFGHFYHSDIMEPEKQRDEAQGELETLQGEVAELETQYDYLREASVQLERQNRVIDILMPPNRILWSEKFNQISQCAPDNVYLTNIQVDEEVREVPTPESQARHDAWVALPKEERVGPEPELVLVPSIIQTVSIEGATFAQQRETRIQLVLDFWHGLVNHETTGRNGDTRRFMDHFEGVPFIDFNETQDVAGVEVNAFRLVLRTVDLATLGQRIPETT